jgi:hypothetical protein
MTGSLPTTAPLSAETWPAFEALVQRHNGIFGGCWCTYFHPESPSGARRAQPTLETITRQAEP